MKTSELTHAMRPIHSAQLRMLLSLAKLVSRGTGWDGRDGRDRMGRTGWEGNFGFHCGTALNRHGLGFHPD